MVAVTIHANSNKVSLGPAFRAIPLQVMISVTVLTSLFKASTINENIGEGPRLTIAIAWGSRRLVVVAYPVSFCSFW